MTASESTVYAGRDAVGTVIVERKGRVTATRRGRQAARDVQDRSRSYGGDPRRSACNAGGEAMTGFSAAELLSRHNIAYRQTRSGKYSTACPDCKGEGYLRRQDRQQGRAMALPELRARRRGILRTVRRAKQTDRRLSATRKPFMTMSTNPAHDCSRRSVSRRIRASKCFASAPGRIRSHGRSRASGSFPIGFRSSSRTSRAGAPSSSSRAKRTSTICAAAAFPRPAIRWARRSGGRNSTRYGRRRCRHLRRQ